MSQLPPVVILGAGGHASVLVATLRLCAREILGVLGPDKPAASLGVDYLGGDDALRGMDQSRFQLINGLGSVGRIAFRADIFREMKRGGFTFSTVIHPSAIVDSAVTFGEGVQVMAGSIIQTGARLRDNTLINTGAIVDHDCCIGPHSHVAPGAVLSGGVELGEAVHVGSGATVRQGTRIGSRSVIGSGAVVLVDVAADLLVAGVPAKPVSPKRGDAS